jgi:hypothetical protein
MTFRANLSVPFSKPINPLNGTRLATLIEARMFLRRLPREQVTPSIYYAGTLLDQALRNRKARDVEKARLELIRAFRAAGWI